MPRIIPEARCFSMLSTDVGAEVLRNRALNCWPWVRSLTQLPDAVTHSPAGMADQGDQLAVATGLDPDDAKAILGVLVGDALDQSGERLVIGWRGLALHDGSHSGPISKRCDITGRT